MCDEISNDKPLLEAINESHGKGWIPILVIMAKEGDREGNPGADLTHIHYLWNVDPQAILSLLMSAMNDIMEGMARDKAKEDWHRERRN